MTAADIIQNVLGISLTEFQTSALNARLRPFAEDELPHDARETGRKSANYISKEVKAQMVQEAREGVLSCKELAFKYDVAPITVRRAMRQHGIVLPTKWNKEVSRSAKELAVRELREGKCVYTIARRLGVLPDTVTNWSKTQ